MLAATKFLYASGTHSMKVSGAAGHLDLLIQPHGVRQGDSPLQTAVWHLPFWRAWHDPLLCATCRIQLGSGRWMFSLMHADGVATAATVNGLQGLLVSISQRNSPISLIWLQWETAWLAALLLVLLSMQAFCLSLGWPHRSNMRILIANSANLPAL